MSIPTFAPAADRPEPVPPRIVLQISVTEGEATRRAGIVLTGSRGILEADGETAGFASRDLWRVVRDLLPDVSHLRHDPAPVAGHRPEPPEAEGFAEDCRAVVAIVTGIEDEEAVALRTWLATATEVYAVEPGGPVTAAPGAVASGLVWDVTGAMERLVHTLGAAS
ncbi:hypothetical protein [Nocardioides sp. AE5]|uniref:hypothetical protein n=1 Tax=Nocardioides sp. AE5 TaxID=2962573 RepID=UPI0028828500|nr:hypothetical protein [Nocardioides sp. AE5]MDT0203654.1 hypothetical protein [Nocardioides sp. AE5]